MEGSRNRRKPAGAFAWVGVVASAGARQSDFSMPIALVDHKVGMLRCPQLKGSVVGPGAEITREFHARRAMRLWVGERAEIALA